MESVKDVVGVEGKLPVTDVMEDEYDEVVTLEYGALDDALELELVAEEDPTFDDVEFDKALELEEDKVEVDDALELVAEIDDEDDVVVEDVDEVVVVLELDEVVVVLELDEVVEVLELDEVVEVLELEVVEVLELDVVDEEVDELVEVAPQAPVIDGTAFGPLPIATRFVPQFAAFARRRF